MGYRKKKRARLLVRLLFSLFLIGLFVAAAGTAVLCIAEASLKKEADPLRGNAIIVLGAQVKADGSVSLQLEARLEKALEAYREKSRPVIVCGGQGANEPCPEARVMKEWLMNRGVPETDILTDDRSVNTFQNLVNAQELLGEETKEILIVTSDYHLPRALVISREAGFISWGLPADTLPEYWLKNHSRELLAWGKLLFRLVTGVDVYLPI